MKHTIRGDIDGRTVEVNLTYRTAIRRFCLECMGFVKGEVEGCTAPLCPLYPFRTGHCPTGRSNPNAIKALETHRKQRGKAARTDLTP